jgi:hypothetical protein
VTEWNMWKDKPVKHTLPSGMSNDMPVNINFRHVIRHVMSSDIIHVKCHDSWHM